MKLYPYQKTVVTQIAKAFRKHRRVLFTLPTGAGKTYVISHVTREFKRTTGKDVLILAHRRELVEQLATRLVEDGVPQPDLGIIMSRDSRENELAAFQVASIDTLIRREELGRFGMVVVDEAHRAVANKFQKVMGRYPEAKILGATATPCRLDHIPMGDAFDELVVGERHQQLFEGKYLVRPRVFSKGEAIDMKDVKLAGGDFESESLERVVNRPTLRGDIVEHFRAHAGARATIGFAVNRQHAKDLVETFNQAGIHSEVVDSGTTKKDREDILGREGRLAKGRTKVVWTVDIASEGLDRAFIKCIIMARPTRSLVVYMQQCGRGLRPYGNTTPIILDHAGNAMRFGLPQEPRMWSLDDAPKRGARVGNACKICPGCGETVGIGDLQCLCGYTFPVRRIPDTEAGELEELASHVTQKRYQYIVREMIGRAPAAWLEDIRVALGATP